jgi:hypothetical protein
MGCCCQWLAAGETSLLHTLLLLTFVSFTWLIPHLLQSMLCLDAYLRQIFFPWFALNYALDGAHNLLYIFPGSNHIRGWEGQTQWRCKRKSLRWPPISYEVFINSISTTRRLPPPPTVHSLCRFSARCHACLGLTESVACPHGYEWMNKTE